VTTESRHYEDGAGYDRWTARWSEQMARILVPWLGARRDARWLDVGCGTGAVSDAVMDLAWPGEVTGIDSSAPFLELARRKVPGARFDHGKAVPLPYPDGSFEAVVSSLLVAYLPDPAAALREMARVAVPGGVVGVVVWDAKEDLGHPYREAAKAAGVADVEEVFPAEALEREDALSAALGSAGLREVQVQRLATRVAFEGFDDYWASMLARKGKTTEHLESLPASTQAVLRESLRALVEPKPGAKVVVEAVAWAGKGRR
jgi:ubiquinone/menaquinone biosynthesis C-methylase UbiE